jgi:hypothetical protein
MTHNAAPAFNSAAASKVGVQEAVGGGRPVRVRKQQVTAAVAFRLFDNHRSINIGVSTSSSGIGISDKRSRRLRPSNP